MVIAVIVIAVVVLVAAGALLYRRRTIASLPPADADEVQAQLEHQHEQHRDGPKHPHGFWGGAGPI